MCLALDFVLQPYRPWTYYGGQYNESRFYVLHQDFLRYVQNRSPSSHNTTQTFDVLCFYTAMIILQPQCFIKQDERPLNIDNM